MAEPFELIVGKLDEIADVARAGDLRMETRVAQLVHDGKSNNEISALLRLSMSTILTHRHHARVKLGLRHQKKNLRAVLKAL